MKTKTLTFVLLGLMLLASWSGIAQEILYDGSFSATTEIVLYSSDPPPMNIWCAFQNYGTDAYASVVNNACYYQVTNPGYEAWEVQLTQYGFQLIPEHDYRLSFDVKADAPRYFGVFLGEYWGNWINLLGWETYAQFAGTEWQTITLDFKAVCTFEINKISFEIGGINTGMYFDNILITDLGPYMPSVGIIGTSVMGWDTDVNMNSTDSITYTLLNYPLTSGKIKFRQDDNWCINWGGTTFPTGAGYIYGPDITVTNPGNYDILFNRITGEYSFTCITNCTPYIGVIGTAVPPNFDTGPDVDMSTSDGITYTLHAYPFTDGLAKFRQDNSWDMNWGNTSFPIGTAILNGTGNDIPVVAGKYTVTFNLTSGDYSFAFPGIGILGSALTGWDTDIDLTTTDGVIYTLLSYPFTDGEVKFREDNDWMVNWGGYTFPSGWGWQDGPNIPVPAGTYDVTFNASTGEYLFVATTCPVPGIQCPDPVYTQNTPGDCGAYVFYPDVIPAPNCGGAGIQITQTAGLTSGSFFPMGLTTNTYQLTNADGNTASCSFDIFVYDAEPPSITGINDYLAPLWPPNHKMVLVPIEYDLSDNCGTANSELSVFSNEPVSGTGPGDLEPDWVVVDNHSVWLRAERAGNGTGREYYILITAYDDSWNYSGKIVIVPVPHDMRKVKDMEDSGSQADHVNAVDPAGSAGFSVEVKPNPSRNGFEMAVETTSCGPVEVSVFDVTGRMIHKSLAPANQNIHFGEDFHPGVYSIQVRQNDITRTLKLLKL